MHARHVMRGHVMHAQTPMVPRIGDVAGDGKNCNDSGKTYNAKVKPVAGFDTHPGHYAPRP